MANQELPPTETFSTPELKQYYEQVFWPEYLKAYQDLLKRRDADKTLEDGEERESYYSYKFTDLYNKLRFLKKLDQQREEYGARGEIAPLDLLQFGLGYAGPRRKADI